MNLAFGKAVNNEAAGVILGQQKISSLIRN
jgi:hypothetical protein